MVSRYGKMQSLEIRESGTSFQSLIVLLISGFISFGVSADVCKMFRVTIKYLHMYANTIFECLRISANGSVLECVQVNAKKVRVITSQKHAYIILIPLNPTFI